MRLPSPSPWLAISLIGIVVSLIGCQALEQVYLEGDQPKDARIRLVVGSQDTFAVSSSGTVRARSVHLEWDVPEEDFPRFPYLVDFTISSQAKSVFLDTIEVRRGKTDFLWECPRSPFSDTTSCLIGDNIFARVIACLPEGRLLQVGWAEHEQ